MKEPGNAAYIYVEHFFIYPNVYGKVVNLKKTLNKDVYNSFVRDTIRLLQSAWSLISLWTYIAQIF